MKKASKVILIIVSVIIAIVSLAFVILEGRLVLSFDWSLHEHEFLGFIQYVARLGITSPLSNGTFMALSIPNHVPVTAPHIMVAIDSTNSRNVTVLPSFCFTLSAIVPSSMSTP